MIRTEISFGPEIKPLQQSNSRGFMTYVAMGLGKSTRINAVVVDKFALPFRVLDKKSRSPGDHRQIVFSLPPQEDESRQNVKISSNVTLSKEAFTKVGEVVFEREKTPLGRLPLVRQYTERKEIRRDKKGATRKNALSFTRDCIANGMFKNQTEVNTFLRKMLGSDSRVLTADLAAALGSELIIWGINVPAGGAILAATGGDVKLAFAAGVAVQGLVRFPWWFKRTKEEMGLLWKEKNKSRKNKVKVVGFGAMYGLMFATNFVPGAGSGPILIMSAPRNTEYVLKNIELQVRKGVRKVREFGEKTIGLL